jgi:hypothetical protein
MKVKNKLPKGYVMLDNDNPIIQNVIINTFNQLGINVYENTKEFDHAYPYLYWTGRELCQRVDCEDLDELGMEDVGVTKTADDFLSYFITNEDEKETVKISDQYNAVITGKHIIVGCQTINRKTFEGIIKAAKKVGFID